MTEFDNRKHGGSLYRRGCRCEICVQAMVEYRRQYRVTDKPSKLKLPVRPLLEWVIRTESTAMVHPRALWRWLSNPDALMDVYWADRYAIQLGTHPMNIWGMAFYADIPVGEPV